MAEDNVLGEVQHIQLSEKESKSFFEIPPTKRAGKWLIEVPKLLKTEQETFIRATKKVIPAALEEVDPRIRRTDVTVLFENSLITKNTKDDEIVYKVGGHAGMVKDNLRVITLAYDSLNIQFEMHSDTDKHISILGLILHELFEEDYHLKSAYLQDKPEKFNLKNKEDRDKYSEAEHEIIPSERAAALLTKVLGGKYVVTYNNRVVASYPRSRFDR